AIRTIVYCSNTPALDSTGFPILNGTDPRLPSSTAIPSNIGKASYLLNFMFYLFVSSTQNPGASSFGDTNPCVMWFGENYPSSPIAVRPNATVQALASTAYKDSTYFPGPSTGYLQTIATPPVDLVNAYDISDDAEVLSQYQLRPWAIVAASAAASPQLGSAPQKALFNITAIPAIFSSPLGFNPTNGATPANGLFDTIEPRVWYSLDQTTDSLLGIQQVPFFETASNLTTVNDINTEMGNILRQTILALSKVDKSALTEANPAPSVLASFFDSVAEATNGLPYAGLTFQTVDHSNRTYQIGSDIRLTRAANYPAQGKRIVLFQALLGSALLRSSNPANLGTATITQGIRLMPDITTTALKSTYYISQYITLFLLYLLSAIVFLVFGRIAKISMFVNTQGAVLAILFLLWGNVQSKSECIEWVMKMRGQGLREYPFHDIASVILTISHRKYFLLSQVLVFLIVLVSVVISIVSEQLFVNGPAPLAYFIWPPFAFYRSLTLINEASFLQGSR
ncbi:hypothetical protein BDK51DRAFT_29199, partial [Blyttiomyces helicus]